VVPRAVGGVEKLLIIALAAEYDGLHAAMIVAGTGQARSN
jgi:hypothetical protein